MYFTLNCNPHNMSTIIQYQSLIRAAVIDSDNEGGARAAALLDSLLAAQPAAIREACITLGYYLSSTLWYEKMTLQQARHILAASMYSAPADPLMVDRASRFAAAALAIARYTSISAPSDSQIRVFIRLTDGGSNERDAARHMIAAGGA